MVPIAPHAPSASPAAGRACRSCLVPASPPRQHPHRPHRQHPHRPRFRHRVRKRLDHRRLHRRGRRRLEPVAEDQEVRVVTSRSQVEVAVAPDRVLAVEVRLQDLGSPRSSPSRRGLRPRPGLDTARPTSRWSVPSGCSSRPTTPKFVYGLASRTAGTAWFPVAWNDMSASSWYSIPMRGRGLAAILKSEFSSSPNVLLNAIRCCPPS